MQKKSNKKKVVLSIFIVVIMVSSIAGFISFSPDEDSNKEIEYKNIKFTKINEQYTTIFNNNQITISKNPLLLEEQNMINPQKELNSAQKIYISINPKEDINRVVFELNNLIKVLRPKAITSCYIDIEECKKLPIKTCKDATNLNKVIILKKENTKTINYKNNCLEIIGSDNDIITFIDQLILSTITNENQ